MTEREHLLQIVSEECAEVAHRASKCIRFTMDEVQHGQELNNAQRLMVEFSDLLGAMELLSEMGHLKDANIERLEFTPYPFREMIEAKKRKIAEYMDYSVKIGTLKLPGNEA